MKYAFLQIREKIITKYFIHVIPSLYHPITSNHLRMDLYVSSN